jgi:RNA polymerase sigma-70 factor (ECF subfamily)
MQREGLQVAPSTPSERVEDADLMAALVRGDREAIAALYDRHASLLLALAVRMLQDRAQAEELLHDVFLEAWHHARDFDPARGTVRAWLLTRMRSRALDRRAQRARQARVAEQAALQPTAPALGDLEGSAGGGLDAQRVRQGLASLPPDLTAVLELAYFEGLSGSEIAERLGIPIGTVKSRTARALAALREQLGSPAGGAP